MLMSPLEMDIAIIMALVLLIIGIMFVAKYAFGKKPEENVRQPMPTAAPLDWPDPETARIRDQIISHSLRRFGRRPGKISIK